MALRLGLLLFVGWLVAPFVTSILLACGVTGRDGTYLINVSSKTCAANFGDALQRQSNSDSDLISALITSVTVCLPSALFAVILAAPAAERLATVWAHHRENACIVALATRVLPATVAVPVFWAVLKDAGHGKLVLAALYSVMLLPIACAILSAGQWGVVLDTEALLRLDAPMTPFKRTCFRVRAMFQDVLLTVTFLTMLGWSDALFPSRFLKVREGEVTMARFLDQQQGFLGTDWGKIGASVILSVIPLLFLIGLVLSLRRRGGQDVQS